MVDPSDLLDAIVTALRSNAPLVALLGNLAAAESIIPYYTDYSKGATNLEQRIFDQKPNSILACWLQTRTGNFNKGEAIKHDFALYLKPTARVSAVFTSIREGVCTVPGDSAKFKHLTIDPSVNPPENVGCRARTNFISQQYGLFDFTEITFTLTERGADV